MHIINRSRIRTFASDDKGSSSPFFPLFNGVIRGVARSLTLSHIYHRTFLTRFLNNPSLSIELGLKNTDLG